MFRLAVFVASVIIAIGDARAADPSQQRSHAQQMPRQAKWSRPITYHDGSSMYPHMTRRNIFLKIRELVTQEGNPAWVSLVGSHAVSSQAHDARAMKLARQQVGRLIARAINGREDHQLRQIASALLDPTAQVRLTLGEHQQILSRGKGRAHITLTAFRPGFSAEQVVYISCDDKGEGASIGYYEQRAGVPKEELKPAWSSGGGNGPSGIRPVTNGFAPATGLWRVNASGWEMPYHNGPVNTRGNGAGPIRGASWAGGT